MGEGQSKPQTSNKTSVATGDIDTKDLQALHSRCLPKGMAGVSVHEKRGAPAGAPVVAGAPVAAPPTAFPAAPTYANIGGGANPTQFLLAPGAGPLQRSSSMVRTAGMQADIVNLQRSSSMVRTGAQMPVMGLPGQGGSLLVPLGAAQPMPLQGLPPRSGSLVIPMGAMGSALVRSDSMVRASGQNIERSSSMLRTSEQQEVLLSQNASMPMQYVALEPNGMQRATSMVRTSAQQAAYYPAPQQIAQPPRDLLLASQPPMDMAWVAAQQPQLTTQAPSLVPQAWGSQLRAVVPQTPSTVPQVPQMVQQGNFAAPVGASQQTGGRVVQVIRREPHAPREGQMVTARAQAPQQTLQQPPQQATYQAASAGPSRATYPPQQPIQLEAPEQALPGSHVFNPGHRASRRSLVQSPQSPSTAPRSVQMKQPQWQPQAARSPTAYARTRSPPPQPQMPQQMRASEVYGQMRARPYEEQTSNISAI